MTDDAFCFVGRAMGAIVAASQRQAEEGASLMLCARAGAREKVAPDENPTEKERVREGGAVPTKYGERST